MGNNPDIEGLESGNLKNLPSNKSSDLAVTLNNQNELEISRKEYLISKVLDEILEYYKTYSASIYHIVQHYFQKGLKIRNYKEDYFIIEGKVYYKGVEMEGVGNSFKQIEGHFFRYGNDVYYKGNKLEGANFEEFKEFNRIIGNFIFDKSGIYVENGKKIPINFDTVDSIPLNNLKLLDKYGVFTDRNLSFIRFKKIYFYGDFEIITDYRIRVGDTYYFYDNVFNKLYLVNVVEENVNQDEKVKSQFKTLKLKLVKNLKLIEKKQKVLKPKFKISQMKEYLKTPGNIGEYMKTQSEIYGFEYKLYPGLTTTYNYNYVSINGKLYFRGGIILKADFESFKVLDLDLAVDKHNVYFKGKRINGVNPQDFEKTGTKFHDYYLYSGGLIYGGKKLKGFEIYNIVPYFDKKYYGYGINLPFDMVISKKKYIGNFQLSGKYLILNGKWYYNGKYSGKIDMETLVYHSETLIEDKYGKIEKGVRIV